MLPVTSEKDRVGMCISCQYSRLVRTDRGSVFYQCQRSGTDPYYAKYPRLPVLHCRGYEANQETPKKSDPLKIGQ